MKGQFRKIDDKTLVAVNDRAMEALAGVNRGADCIADVRGARNVQQFRLFWSLVRVVIKQTDDTKDGVADWLKVKTRHVDMLFWPDGSMHLKPKSISWESMPQAEFAAFFRAAIPHIADLLGNAPEEILAEFNALLDPEARAHFRKIMRMTESPPIAPSHSDEHAEAAE